MAWEIVTWTSIVQMLGWVLLVPAFILTATLFAKYGGHWAIGVAALVVSVGLIGLGVTVRELNSASPRSRQSRAMAPKASPAVSLRGQLQLDKRIFDP